MRFAARIRSARDALVQSVDPDPSSNLLEQRSATQTARRKRRGAIVGAVAAVALVVVSIALTGDDGSTDVVTAPERETRTGDDSARSESRTDAREDEAGPNDASMPAPAPTQGSAPEGATPPSTVSSGASEPERVCENFVADPSSDDDVADHERVEQEQDRYLADAQTAQSYGRDHPDDFVGVRFLNRGRVRLAIAFARNLSVHCENLRTMLEHPDEFELWQLPWPERELRRVQEEIGTAAGERLRSSGAGFGGPVEVHLRADGEHLARDFVERYGEMVDLRVGLHRYPRDRASDPAPTCEAARAQDGVTAGVEAVLDLDDDEIVRGRDGSGTLTVTNRGTGTIVVSTEPSNGQVFGPGEDAPSAVRDPVGEADVGYPTRELRTAESVTIPVRFSTPACDLSHGYALRAGDYRVVTSVLIEQGGKSTLVRSSPASLRVHD